MKYAQARSAPAKGLQRGAVVHPRRAAVAQEFAAISSGCSTPAPDGAGCWARTFVVFT